MAFIATDDNFITTGWLFHVGDYYLSTISGWFDYEYASPFAPIEYQAKIISESFSGVTMRVDMTSRLMSPSEISFEIDNADGSIDVDDLQGAFVTVSLLLNADIEDPAVTRAWKFYIKPGDAQESYGKIAVTANDILWDKLKGVYPNTQTIASVSWGDAPIADKSACVPKTFGRPYITVAPAMYDEKWYYVLGDLDVDYYFPFFIEAPKEFGNSRWDYMDDDGYLTDPYYNMPIQTIYAKDGSAVVGMQAVIADSDGDSDPDANMVWVSSGVLQSPRVRYLFYQEWNQEQLPGRVLYYIMESFFSSQVEAAVHLSSSSFDAVDSAMDTLMGEDHPYINHGFFQKEQRESLISEYLSNFDCFLSVSTTINMHVFSATSIETFDDNMIEGSFSITSVDSEGIDGGEVIFQLDGDPDDAPTGKITVPIYEDQESITNPSGETLRYRYRIDDRFPAIFGQLWFQRKYAISHRVSFAMSMDDVGCLSTVVPGQVVTVTGESAYGPNEHKTLVTQLEFTNDLQVIFSGDVYFALNDSSDLDPSTPTIESSDESDFTSTAYTVVSTNNATSSINLDYFDVAIGGRFKCVDQDAFQAIMTTDMADVAVDTATTIEFDDETNDNTDAFDTSTYTYTAQGDGWRQFNIIVRAKGLSTDAEHVQISLVTSQETFRVPYPVGDLATETDPVITFSQLVYMDDSDTAYVELKLLGGSGTVGVYSGFTFFSGIFIFNGADVIEESPS